MNAPASSPMQSSLPRMALALLAVDGAALGGAVFRMGPGPEADEWLHSLKNSLPPDTPWRRLPTSIDDDRLLGGLDMTASLAAGRPLLATGLLVEVNSGMLVLPMAERLDRGSAARIASVIDRGAVRLERDGMTRVQPTRFCLLAFDESREDETPLSSDLRDRLALQLSARDFDDADEPPSVLDPNRIQAARQRLLNIHCSEEQLRVLCGTAQALGIDSLRPAGFAVRVARASAALANRKNVGDEDLLLAVQLVLAPRATQLPEAPPEESSEESPPEEQRPEDQADSEPEPPEVTPPSPDTLPADLVLEAVRSALPPGLVASLTSAAAKRQLRARVARGGPPARALRRGRPIGVMRGDPRKGYRLHLPATLKTAAPWQGLRRQTVTGDRADKMQVRADDFRVVRFKSRQPITRIFVVDASGSAAAQRLAETKGAVELLLAESYVTRDQVALIAFRGTSAELLLPPTRALARAKRELAGLPGGGGTPLAAGLHAAWELARDLERKGQHPVLILMTDGRANVCLDGSTGHEAAGEEALHAARQLRLSGWDSLVVDTARRPRPRARALAEAMGARYMPLPQASPGSLSSAAAELETAA